MTKLEYLNKLWYPTKESKCDCCGGNNQPYMINYDLWDQVSLNNETFVCLRCVESKLKRKLKINDFIKAPINYGCFDFDCRVFVQLSDSN